MSIKTLKKTPLSNFDLQDLNNDINNVLGSRKKIHIFTVDELISDPHNFLQYLDNHKFAIIFVNPDNRNIGHWVVLFKNKKGTFFFDSYGLSVEKNDPRLNSFLHKYLPNTKWNGYQYQGWDTSISTCGRYAILIGGLSRIIPDLDLNLFNKIMKHLKKVHNLDYDSLVSKLVNKQI